jgi:hypothetical protein
MEPKALFFEALFTHVSERVAEANPAAGLEISRYGVRGLYFTVKRAQPPRKVEVNLLGPGAFAHFGKAAVPMDVVDSNVAVRLADCVNLTAEQWADDIMGFLLKPEPAQAAAAAASAAPAKAKASAPAKPPAKKPGKKN